MSEPIYILEAEIKADLGFNQIEKVQHYFYFKTYASAELYISTFTDKAVRKFKSKWKLDEDFDDLNIEIFIKEKHLFDE